MELRILDRASGIRTRYPDVPSEMAENDGYSYAALDDASLHLYLGFVGKLQGREATFLNPFWSNASGKQELLPASRNDVSVALSPDALRLGGRFIIDFNGPSPRIKVTFSTAPGVALPVGTATVGFVGVWPMKGTYRCVNLQTQVPALKKALEPFGSVLLRQTAFRILENLIATASTQGLCRIEAADEPSNAFVKDNLIVDLCDLLFDPVANRSVSPKPSVTLPDNMSNSYENKQDGIFSRTVSISF